MAKARFTVKRVYQVIDSTTGEIIDDYGKLADAHQYAAQQNELQEPAKCEVFEPLGDYPGICACGRQKSHHTAEVQLAFDQNNRRNTRRSCKLAEYNGGTPCAKGKDPNYPQLWCTICQENTIQAAIDQFPAEFGLQAFPGKRFKIVREASYFSDFPAPGTIYLYTYIQKPDGGWSSFSKGTARELRGQIVNLKPALLSKEEAAEIRRKAGAR